MWSMSGWPSYRSPKPLDEVQVGFQDDGIIHVGDRERAMPS